MDPSSSTNVSRQDPNHLVDDWMVQYAPDQHAVFRPSTFDDQRAKPPSRLRQQADNLTIDFCNIVQQYENSLSGLQPANKINLREAHSWDEVVQAARRAEAAYLAETKKGPLGAVKGYFRYVGDYSAAANPWVGLLPNDKYFSVLCGGLKLVLGIAAKRSERRMMILEAFDDLPAAILKTQRCFEIFPDNATLRDRALTVYIDLLTMTESMVSCLLEKKITTRIKDGLKGPLADSSLDDKVKRFHKSMEALDEQVNYLHLASTATANSSIARMVPQLDVTSHYAKSTNELAESINQQTNLLGARAGNIGRTIDDVRNEVAFQRNATRTMNERIEANTQAVHHLSSLLQDVLQYAEWREAQYQLVATSVNANTNHQQNLLQLQRLIYTDADTSQKDLQFMLRHAQSSEPITQGAVYWVLQSPRFKYWMQSGTADVLLINGNLEDGTVRFSAMSLLCGLIVQSLRPQGRACVLHFFCGMHNSKSDSAGGPIGMIRNLTVQLLSIRSFDVDFLGSPYWNDGLNSGNPRVFAQLFRKLLEQLPPIIVFCIVDGVSAFDVDGSEELRAIIQVLLEAAMDQERGAQLKLLMSATNTSRCLNAMLNEGNVLSVPVDTGTRRLLNDRAVQAEMIRAADNRRQFDSLGYVPSFEDTYELGYE